MTMQTLLPWLGIAFCISQSAMFSGLNLAFFSVGRLRLEAEAETGNKAARKILRLRQDSNFLLCTILWGNVGVNVLLALLSESVMAGVSAFIFSTVGITIFGEIVPQAYFSRNAMKVGSLLAPVVRVYQVVLFLVAKPSAVMLDLWIGPEGPSFLRERDVEVLLQKHIREEGSEIGATEGRGALNFLSLDDRKISREGVEVAPETVFSFPSKLDLPIIPAHDEPGGDEFVQKLLQTHLKWAIITDERGYPQLVLESDRYLRAVLAGDENHDVYNYCHRPVMVTNPDDTLDDVLDQFVVEAEDRDDRVIDRDVMLYWTAEQRRIVTGADILGRLLQGIVRRAPVEDALAAESSPPESGDNKVVALHRKRSNGE